MSFKTWSTAVLLVLAALVGQPAHAEQGHRAAAMPGTIWLGSLSTGYVVGTPVSAADTYEVSYLHVPISRMVVMDARSGQELWEGRPYVGQTLAFPHDTVAKFIVWSSPERVYPPMSADPNAIANFPKERPVIDAVELVPTHVVELQPSHGDLTDRGWPGFYNDHFMPSCSDPVSTTGENR